MRRVMFLFITLIFISCNENGGDDFKLTGNAFGFDDGTKILVMEIDKQNQTQTIDTLEIKAGKFSGTFPKSDEASVQLLRVNGINTNVLYFAESEDLIANIYRDSITSSYVSGGKQNELYNEYNKELSKIAAKKLEIAEAYKRAQIEQDGIMVTELRNENTKLVSQERGFKREFIKNNSNSLFGMMLLSEMFNRDEITANEANEIMAGLGPKLASNDIVTKLKATIEAKKKAEVGGMAPNFTAPDPNGEMLSLNDALGKYTIIDFWASWCRPCRMENPNVVRVYNKYHDKGLNIISVSLDKTGQKERWIKAIEDDKMDWYHVSNLKFWQDPIARQYNVRSIPATFLLDEEGRIIDKNLRGKALETKIASLLD
ncbi:MAG: AhpC/TSA family protein [Flavobacteriaceae bacterium]|nr:AhpC/TSA family protein [Flavobacteriaceae bacterium]